MNHIWSYIMMALCVSVTSAGVMDFHGNGRRVHGDEVAGPKEENPLAPPSENALNIDSARLLGNSNGKEKEDVDCSEKCKTGNGGNSCLCDLPASVSKALEALLNPNNESNDYQMVPFVKQDIINLESSEVCTSLCDQGIEQPPCKCSPFE